jgi:Cu/Ag efflux pump CusA
MIDQFVALCFRKRPVVRLMAIFAAIFGIYAWSQLAIDAYPLSPVAAQVTVQVPGLAAEEVEQQITIPLERGLNGTPGLTSMRSISTFALSQINLLFRDGAEDYWERTRVRERISDVTLPPGASAGLDSVTAPEFEIYRYTLQSDTKNLMELLEYQRWVVRLALRQVPGVAEVDNFGGFTQQFRLDLDPTELLRYGVAINDVINAINNNTANAGGGRVPRGDQSFIVRGVGLVHTLDDLGNIVVTQTNSMPVLIRDLGEAPVGLTPYDTWPKGEAKADFVRKLNARLHQLPGIDIGITQPISDMMFDAVGGAHSALVIRVVGDDFVEDPRIASEIVDVLRNTRGTAEASIFQEPPLPQIIIEADRAAASRYGINISDITNLIQTGVGGAAVTQVYVGDRIYDVSVRFPLNYRYDPEALGNLTLTNSGGIQVPLSQVAKITQRNGESTITRENNHRNLTIRIDLADRELVSYLAEVKDKIAQSVHFDASKYHLEYGRAIREPGACTAPVYVDPRPRPRDHDDFALHGVRGAAAGADDTRDRPARHFGWFDCAVCQMRDAQHCVRDRIHRAVRRRRAKNIIMVANLNRVRETGASLRDAILIGASERFRPVLMAATVATTGMLPAALATGVGSDVQRSVATVVIGGLILATLLTLFVVPTFYYSLERIVERWSARRTSIANLASSVA